MIVGLDYDGTYSRDPKLFDSVVSQFLTAGHQVICITMRRFPEEAISIPNVEILYTARRAKANYAAEQDVHVDIWIDDKPQWILNDG